MGGPLERCPPVNHVHPCADPARHSALP